MIVPSRSETPPRSSCRSTTRLVAGDLADACGAGPCRAARVGACTWRPTCHDCGWRVWEACAAAERRRPAGPQNFLEVDIDLHLQFYDGGIVTRSPRAIRTPGCSWAKHLAGIYRQRYGTQAALTMKRARRRRRPRSTRSSRAIEERFAHRCSASSASPDDEFWRNYVLLQVFDRLSLWLCKGDPAGTGAMQILLPDDGELAVVPTAGGCCAPAVSARDGAGEGAGAGAGGAAGRLRERRRRRGGRALGARRAARVLDQRGVRAAPTRSGPARVSCSDARISISAVVAGGSGGSP